MNTPSETWKGVIKTQTHQNSLKYLNTNIGSKSRHYTELKMSQFLCSHDNFSRDISKFMAKTLCHMIEKVKMNFQQEYKPNFMCNTCMVKICNQSHLLYCEALIGSNQLVTYIPNYEDIFDDDKTEEQYFIATLMMANLKQKKETESKQ